MPSRKTRAFSRPPSVRKKSPSICGRWFLCLLIELVARGFVDAMIPDITAAEDANGGLNDGVERSVSVGTLGEVCRRATLVCLIVECETREPVNV